MVAGIPVPLPARTPLLDEALAQARDVPYEDVPTRVIAPEHLVAVAVQAGRAKDRQRVQMFLDAGVLDRKRLDGILSRHGWMDGKGFAMDPKRIPVAGAPAGKDAYRAKQRKLSWPGKVKVVIELQKIAKPILAARGKSVTAWPADGWTKHRGGF
ncbi:MAG: hypothetical protein EOM72_01395 [Opitutae bacterium]|nr:hypothetical protein [Opitutae bacterium]